MKLNLGNLTTADFLKRYWQKRPLRVRGAFPGFRDPVSPEELAGLSLEPDVESRLVMERGGKKPWEVVHGPQQAGRLRRLPRSHWTLLVQGVDRCVPGVAALLESFRFIPEWRVDDVMVSFAPRGGSVGPHLDSYDVFLIQGKGRRRWRIDTQAGKALRPGLDLRILKDFSGTEEWVLEAGDMLYLPPELAHYGVALEDCLTYSVGFRSPSALDLLLAVQERISQSGGGDRRYQDSDLKPTLSPGEIPRAALRRLRKLMESAVREFKAEDFDALMGTLLTDPKGFVIAPPKRMNAATLRSRLARGAVLVRSPGSRLAFFRRDAAAELFADGRRFPLPGRVRFAAPLLSGRRRFRAGSLSRHLDKKGFLQLLVELVRSGTFRLELSGEEKE